MVVLEVKGEIKSDYRIISIKFSPNFKKSFSVLKSVCNEFVNEIKKCKSIEEIRIKLNEYGLELNEKEYLAIKLDVLICSILKYPFNEDIYQELFLKGWQILKQSSIQNLPEHKKWAYVHRSLLNKYYDICKVCKQRQIETFNEFTELDSNILSSNLNPEEFTIIQDLIEKIKKWVEIQQDEDTKIFFKEYFNPSKEVLEHISMQASKRTWKNRDFSPLYLAKILTELGKWKYKDPRDKWLKIRKKLRKYLLNLDKEV